MALKITNIDWDTDGEDVTLPSELVIDPVAEGIENPSEQVADFLSDRYGWCVKGFVCEQEPDSDLDPHLVPLASFRT
jgi:hypothetical protein